MAKDFLLLMVAVGCLASPVVSFQQRQPDSEGLAGPLPLPETGVFGQARFIVAGTAAGATMVDVLNEEPKHFGHRLLGRIQSWRLPSGHPPVQVEVHSRERKTDPCSADLNPYVELALPTLIEVYTQPITLCEDAELVSLISRPTPLRGTTVNDMGRPIPGVMVRISNVKENITRVVRTDSAGHFVAHGLPPGSYSVHFYGSLHEPYTSKEFALTIREGAPDDDWTVALGPNRILATLPPVVVTDADIPSYPSVALANGRAGTVDVRVSLVPRSPGSQVFQPSDIDATGTDPLLVQAARANVTTWRFRDAQVPVLKISFTFRMLPGDCGPDQRVKAVMRFPYSVELAAKRRVSCQAN